MFQRLKDGLKALPPSPQSQEGLLAGLLLGVELIFVLWVLAFQLNVPVWLQLVVVIPLGGLVVWLGYLGLRLALDLLAAIPRSFLAAGLGFLIALSTFLNQNLETAWPLIVGGMLVTLALGGGIGGLRTAASDKQRWTYGLVLGAAVIGLAVSGWWLFTSPPDPLAHIAPYRGAPIIDAPNPGLPGTFAVETLSYGSGEDRWRPEYGANVDIQTANVNATYYVTFEDNWKQDARVWFWGFGRDALPRNGLVWRPVGEGPFPLVLIAHGNHSMTDFSEAGYAYLGELLASRGFIVVSMDANFLNGGVFGSVTGENDARAWLLLQHIALFEYWNQQSDSPFFGQVDLDHIALIGHSRGGEAVALAAAFNQLGRNPNNAALRWDYQYGIQAVVALAPVDGQHQPGGAPVALHDIYYLVLQGAADGDVSAFYGLRQYQRASFSPDSLAFKSALYFQGGNHAQFNSQWGRRDLRPPRGWLLNVEGLLSVAEQQALTSLYISALVETALRGDDRYRPLFENYQTGGDWLPEMLMANLYADGSQTLVADFEEDIDVTTATAGSIRASGLARWRELNLPLRGNKPADNKVVELGWNSPNDQYAITLDTPYSAGSSSLLIFDVANADKQSEQLLDFRVQVGDAAGQTGEVILSDYLLLLPQLKWTFSQYTPWAAIRYPDPSQPVPQSYRIPLVDFEANNPDLDLSAILRITFLFDQSPAGRIMLDAVGFSQ
jgi:dienelactone hydrolase